MFKALVFISNNRYLRCFYLSILLIILSVHTVLAEPNLLSSSNRITHFHYIQDRTRTLNIDSAKLLFKQGKHKTLTDNAFNIGNSDDVYWVLFSVVNDSSDVINKRLLFGSPFVPVLNAYLLSDKEADQVLLRHDKHQPFGLRFNDKALLNSMPFDIPAKKQIDIIVQYQPRGISFLPVSLESDTDFFNKTQFKVIQSAIFYSFSLAVIVTFIFFGIAMRSNIVLFYALLFLEYIFFIAIIEGYAFKYIWPDWPQWNMVSGLVASLVFTASGFFMSLIVVEKTGLFRQFKVFCKSMSILCLAMLLLIPIVGNVTMMTINHISFLLMLGCQAYCIYSWMSSSIKRNLLAFYSVILFIAAGFYIFIVFLDSSALSEWLLVSFNRITYLIVSLLTMGSFAVHLAGLRRDHERSLKKELLAARRDAELNKALFESEQNYSQARDLANKRQLQLATASHDIRQPLLSLRSTIDVMTQGEHSDMHQQLQDAFSYIENLCNSYLSDTRPATNQNQIAPVDTEHNYTVDMILDSVSKMFHQEALDKGLLFRKVNCSANISCSPVLLIRILSNFVSNAIKHCKHGKILLGCRRLPDHLRLDVYDTGIGISEEQLSTITQAYNKGEKSSGEGLGLAIVNELAESHDWEFSIASKHGKGSRFSITVPAKFQ